MKPQIFPVSQPCVNCGHYYSGAVCNLCGEENPTYTAIKSISRQQEEKGLDAVKLAGQVC